MSSLPRRIDDQYVLAGIAGNVDGLHRAAVGVELLKLFEPPMRIVDRDLVAVLLLDADEPCMMKNPEHVDRSEDRGLALDCAEALDPESLRAQLAAAVVTVGATPRAQLARITKAARTGLQVGSSSGAVVAGGGIDCRSRASLHSRGALLDGVRVQVDRDRPPFLVGYLEDSDLGPWLPLISLSLPSGGDVVFGVHVDAPGHTI